MNLTVPGVRGCGTRQGGGLYLCVGLGPNGRPVYDFLLDPPVAWTGGHFRTPYILEQPGSDGAVNDVLMWVGAEFYPYIPDFIEEVRGRGLSKRIPKNFPLHHLTPGKSRILLVHSKAKPRFSYSIAKQEAPPTLPQHRCQHAHRADAIHLAGDPDEHCVHALWPLSCLESVDKLHEVQENTPPLWAVQVATPSGTYDTDPPLTPAVGEDVQYAPGIFAAFWVSHCECVSEDMDLPEPMKLKAGESGVPIIPMPQ